MEPHHKNGHCLELRGGGGAHGDSPLDIIQLSSQHTLHRNSTHPTVTPQHTHAQKFLLNKEGKLVKRYSRFYPTKNIEADIAALL